jgi:hypothetical protein
LLQSLLCLRLLFARLALLLRALPHHGLLPHARRHVLLLLLLLLLGLTCELLLLLLPVYIDV